MRKRILHFLDRQPTQSATLIGWVFQAINIGAHIVIMPLLLFHFGKELAGGWFYMLGWLGFFQLCDFGIGESLSRQVAFSQGEASLSVRIPGSKFLHVYGMRSSYAIFIAGRRFFRRIVIVALAMAILAERTILFSGRMNGSWELHVTWYLIILSGVGYVLARPYQCFLIGLLKPGWEKVSSLAAVIVTHVLVIIVLSCRAPMWVVGLALCAGGWFQYVVSRIVLARRCSLQEYVKVCPKKSVARALWSLSWQQGVATTSAFLIFSINPMLVGHYMGPGKVAEYYLPWKIANVLMIGIFGMFVPHLSFMVKFVSEHRVKELLARFLRLVIVSAGSALVVYSGYALVGRQVVLLWSGGGVDVGAGVLIIFAAYHMLAVLQTLCACFVVAHGRQPFAVVASFGAAANVVLGCILIPRLGILGSVFGTMLAQLVTSNWYIVYRCIRLLAAHLDVLKDGFSMREIWAGTFRVRDLFSARS